MSSDSSDPFSGFPEAPRSATSDIPSDPSPFRSWAFIIVHLLSSAFLLLFVFWTLMTYRALEAMRSREASSAHLLIVFDQPPPKKEIAGLQATLEKIVGTGNVSPMSVQAGQGPTERRTRQRVLSVLLAPGQDAAGRPVLLADMIRSISQVVHNDARIQDVVYSPDWISRVDSLMFLSLGIRKGLLLVGALAAVSLSLYWGLMGPPPFQSPEATLPFRRTFLWQWPHLNVRSGDISVERSSPPLPHGRVPPCFLWLEVFRRRGFGGNLRPDRSSLVLVPQERPLSLNFSLPPLTRASS